MYAFAITARKVFALFYVSLSMLNEDAKNAKAEFKTQLMQNLSTIYDIRRDDQVLRACLNDGAIQQKAFDDLRKNYPLRREWSAFGAGLS